jgi:hypothetical protein
MDYLSDEELHAGDGSCIHDRITALYDALDGVILSGAAQTAISDAIDTAVAPITLTAAQKRRAVLRWARFRLEQMDA